MNGNSINKDSLNDKNKTYFTSNFYILITVLFLSCYFHNKTRRKKKKLNFSCKEHKKNQKRLFSIKIIQI